MDREEWQIHMDMAERCVVEGLAQIEKQQRLIQNLEGNGRDATRAQALLTTLFGSGKGDMRNCDRLSARVGPSAQRGPASVA